MSWFDWSAWKNWSIEAWTNLSDWFPTYESLALLGALAVFLFLFSTLMKMNMRVKRFVGMSVIFVLIFYLLAAFLSALDAIAFQERVLRLVEGEDRTKMHAILVKLDELGSEESTVAQKLGSALPVEVLSVRLDQVRVAVDRLSSFQDALRARPEIATAQPVESKSGQATYGDSLSAMGVSLRADFEQLKNGLTEAVEGVQLYEGVENLKEKVAGFEDFPKRPEDCPDLGLANGDGEPSDCLMYLAKFKLGVEELERALIQLDDIVPPNLENLGSVSSDVEEAQVLTSALVEILALPRQQIEQRQQEIKDDLQRVKELADGLEPQLTLASAPAAHAILKSIDNQIAEFGALAHDLAKVKETDQRHFQTGDNGTGNASELISVLAADIDKLEISLEELFPNLKTIEEITLAIASIDGQIAFLDEFGISPDIYSLADVEDEPDIMYRESLQSIQSSIEAMVKALANVTKDAQIANLLMGDPRAGEKAIIILNDFEQFERIRFPKNMLAGVLDPQALAVATREQLDILLVLIAGAVGSMIFMVQYTLRMMLDGQSGNELVERPFSWYVFRPLFGAIVAFAMYLLYKTGQLALGVGGLAESFESGVNIPILALLGLLTGLLCWQALEAIQSKGETWFRSATRKNLWATGLKQALDAKKQSAENCAQRVGCSIAQVDRWIEFRDRVTPEMQDRVTTWLDMQRSEIFTSLFPVSNRDADKDADPKFAVGLAAYLAKGGVNLDEDAIARYLRISRDTVERWRDQKEPVLPQFQWQLLELLGERYSEFFEDGPDAPLYWAVRLREHMEKAGQNAAQVAAALGSTHDQVRAWRELQAAVPKQTATKLLAVLGRLEVEIFKKEFSNPCKGYVLDADKFETALLAKYPKVDPAVSDADHLRSVIGSLEQDMDLAPGSVDNWRNGNVLVFEPTAVAIAQRLSARVHQFADLIGPP